MGLNDIVDSVQSEVFPPDSQIIVRDFGNATRRELVFPREKLPKWIQGQNMDYPVSITSGLIFGRVNNIPSVHITIDRTYEEKGKYELRTYSLGGTMLGNPHFLLTFSKEQVDKIRKDRESEYQRMQAAKKAYESSHNAVYRFFRPFDPLRDMKHP